MIIYILNAYNLIRQIHIVIYVLKEILMIQILNLIQKMVNGVVIIIVVVILIVL